ncbi:MAG: M50 family metallopeptidase, partial [Bacteroidales bacterium]|nr:M50 family metallopeptidase [Bacteroidales bacterium]
MHQTLFGIPFVFFFVVLALLLNRIPFLGKFFNIINTELHELGHALMALLFQGEVHKIEIFGDSSGVTTTRMKTRAGNILVALAGYPFASGMAFFSFYLLDKNLQTQYIIGLTLLFVMVCVLFVRNKYGWLWVIVFSAINIVLLHYA